MRLLIVEDDRTIAENLYEYLEARGHQCDYADSLAAAIRLLEVQEFDVAILDRALPDGDGLSLARRLRAAGSTMPLLVLTARDTLEDKLLGFDAGADDYLVKPFALPEVEVRLLALHRRVGAARSDSLLRHGALEYDGAALEARLQGQMVDLPPKALRLLAELLSQPKRVFSRRELEIAVWGHEQDSSDNLRSLLRTMRRALDDAGAQAGLPAGSVEVLNVHGRGYKLICH